jgi:ATP/maltotriose-dependent transcriptional regulator MalT
MANKIAPNEQTGKILAEKNKEFFFIEKYTGNDVIFGYHDLFRDFLVKQSKDYYGCHLDAVISQAADILEEHGYIEESAERILKIKNWGRFEELIFKHVQNLIDDGKHTLVDNWFSVVPDECMQEHPWLLFWQGVNKMYLNPDDSRRILETAYRIFKKYITPTVSYWPYVP